MDCIARAMYSPGGDSTRVLVKIVTGCSREIPPPNLLWLVEGVRAREIPHASEPSRLIRPLGTSGRRHGVLTLFRPASSHNSFSLARYLSSSASTLTSTYQSDDQGNLFLASCRSHVGHNWSKPNYRSLLFPVQSWTHSRIGQNFSSVESDRNCWEPRFCEKSLELWWNQSVVHG